MWPQEMHRKLQVTLSSKNEGKSRWPSSESCFFFSFYSPESFPTWLSRESGYMPAFLQMQVRQWDRILECLQWGWRKPGGSSQVIPTVGPGFKVQSCSFLSPLSAEQVHGQSGGYLSSLSSCQIMHYIIIFIYSNISCWHSKGLLYTRYYAKSFI